VSVRESYQPLVESLEQKRAKLSFQGAALLPNAGPQGAQTQRLDAVGMGEFDRVIIGALDSSPYINPIQGKQMTEECSSGISAVIRLTVLPRPIAELMWTRWKADLARVV